MNITPSNSIKQISIRLVAVCVFIYVCISVFQTSSQIGRGETLDYTSFLKVLDEGRISSLQQRGDVVSGVLKPTVTAVPSQDSSFKIPSFQQTGANQLFSVVVPSGDRSFVKKVVDRQIPFTVLSTEDSLMSRLFWGFGPFILFVWLVIFLNKKQKTAANPFSFGRMKTKTFVSEQVQVGWDDVGGVDDAKADLKEVVEFLKNPEKFKSIGGRIPKGVLLVGEPGCGKTHLSRALACEAGAQFFSLSGSDFVEMFVGVGASRVRDLFEQARSSTPSIIFIDEIDAVGKRRGQSLTHSNDEREQTLNALLVEMDGFNQAEGVLVIAATNRPDVLDAALLRPGRFDRRIDIPLPDLKGRAEILGLCLKKVIVDPFLDVQVVARGTPGFSGADLANLVNEAALLSARLDKSFVGLAELEQAKDKILMGGGRTGLVISEDDKKDTAYHEVGHALVNHVLTGTDPIHKISIIPRGRSLGMTVMLPEKDRYGFKFQELKSKVAVLWVVGRLKKFF